MAQCLKQSTAATIKFGPFVDSTDGFTAKTALSIAQANIRLTKNGGSFAQTHNAAGATHDENGYYGVPLDTTDTDTLGRLRVACIMAGALPVWQDFVVVAANVFDSLIGGGDLLDISVVQLLGTAWLTPGTAGTPDVNAKLIGGTAQTGRDNGTGNLPAIVNDYATGKVPLQPTVPTRTLDVAATGEAGLDFDNIHDATGAHTLTNITVGANLTQILGAAISGTAALIVAAFTKFFNIASPTGTVNSLPDAVPGAAGGLPTTNGTKMSQTVDLTAGQSIAVSDKTGFSLSVAGILAIWNQLETDAGLVVNSIGLKLHTLLVSAGGKVSAIFLRWLTDDAAGTPVALDANHYVEVNAMLLNNATPNNLPAGAAMDLVDALKNKAGATGYDRTTDSMEALGENIPITPPTPQGIRDAMKLAPSVGASAEDSIDDKLDDIPTTPPSTLTSQDVRDAMKLAPSVGASDEDSIDDKIDDLPTPPAMITQQQVRDAMLLVATAPGIGAEDSIDDKLDDIPTSVSTLTDQNVRDAMKLAPSAGAPVIGSVDEHLNDILTDTGTTLPATLADMIRRIKNAIALMLTK